MPVGQLVVHVKLFKTSPLMQEVQLSTVGPKQKLQLVLQRSHNPV